ncbi:hypothetical protein ACI799_20840 [Blastococcus sp. SYSU DS0753]
MTTTSLTCCPGHGWSSVPLRAAGPRTLSDERYAAKLAAVDDSIADRRWLPVEDAIQALITAAAHLPRTRDVWLEEFFTTPTRCPRRRCGAPAELIWCARVADWVIRCAEPACPYHAHPLASAELKPYLTVGQWSRTTAAEYHCAAHAGLIVAQAGWTPPTRDCTPVTCADPTCDNPHTVGKSPGWLAAPQVIRAALLGARPHKLTPVVLLADASRGDASLLYETPEWLFTLNPAAVRTEDLATRLTAVSAALAQHAPAMDSDELAVTRAAVRAVWARLPWGPFEQTLATPVADWLTSADLDAAERELTA